MDLKKKILKILESGEKPTARELAQRFKRDKSQVNSMLYKLKGKRLADVDSSKRWSLNNAGPKPEAVLRSEEGPEDPVVASPVADSSRGSREPEERITWTTEQYEIVNSPPDARILVEAGPGTGKTAVACARVGKLLAEDNLSPSSILMVSFTRTAVAEMKNRIGLWESSGRVNAVNICTLDQAAFSFGIGCGEKFENLMCGFDDNIDAAVNSLQQNNPLLLEYLSGLRHMIVDEAQDLMGQRSRLVRLLIGLLPREAGATIFADGAQAIYGFTNDIDGKDEKAEQFLDSFDAGTAGFSEVRLEKIHRTQEPHILKLFESARNALANGSVEDVIKAATSASDDYGDDAAKLPLQDGDLVLYRKRASALMHTQFYPGLFRLRLPGYPAAVHPWIGAIFGAYGEDLVSRSVFCELWKQRAVESVSRCFTSESAWNLLRRFASDRDDVSLSKLRRLLARARPRVEFCELDYGSFGPIFSTIHASKGREAGTVFLMMPRNLDYLDGDGGLDHNEEARVFYVGSTRARSAFRRGVAQTLVGAGRLEKTAQRVAQILSLKKWPKFQIGLQGDLDELACVGREPAFCASDAAADLHQSELLDLWSASLVSNSSAEVSGELVRVVGADGKEQWIYRFTCGEKILGWSGRSLSADLWSACNAMQQRAKCGRLKPPDKIARLKFIGLRTCAVEIDSPAAARLRASQRSSGFWLAPMITGFPSIMLKFWN